MRKEIIFAILAGIALGVVIAFGLWRTNTALNTDKVAEEKTGSNNASDDQFPKELKIAISSPQDLDVITQSSTKISGITKPGSWVVISSEEEDYTIRSEDTGAFEQEIELTGGVNQILVYVFDEKGASNKQNLTLVYSTEFEE